MEIETPEGATEDNPINVSELLADIVTKARMLVGEAGYPHHYFTDTDQQIRMAVFELFAAETLEINEKTIPVMDSLFRWLKTGVVPSSIKTCDISKPILKLHNRLTNDR